MTSAAQIIFVHRGESLLLKVAIMQAHKSNPSSQIILISDNLARSNFRDFNFVLFYDIADYSKSSDNFALIYKHKSINDYNFELFCYQRWFIVRDFVLELGIEENVVYLDSDALLYMEVSKVFLALKGDMSVCDRVVPSFMFFKSINGLNGFCDFIFSSHSSEIEYQKLQNWVRCLEEPIVVQISDMAALGLYAELNLLEDVGMLGTFDFLFDSHVAFSQGVRLSLIGKRVYRQGNKRFKLTSGGFVEAGGIHLQGWYKQMWPFFVDRKVLWFFRSYFFNSLTTFPRLLYRAMRFQFQQRKH